MLYDQGERWLAGRVASLDAGRVHMAVDAELVRAGAAASMVLERNGELYKAPARTQFSAGSFVRLPLDENVAPDAEERWYYGKVTRAYSGGELVDVKLDTGDECLCIPSWEVPCMMFIVHGVSSKLFLA